MPNNNSTENVTNTDNSHTLHILLVNVSSPDIPIITSSSLRKQTVSSLIEKQVETSIRDTILFCRTTTTFQYQTPIGASTTSRNKHKAQGRFKFNSKSKEHRSERDRQIAKIRRHGNGLEDEHVRANEPEQIVESVLRFKRVRDKLLHFCSLLLKSCLYHSWVGWRRSMDGKIRSGDCWIMDNGVGELSVTSRSIPLWDSTQEPVVTAPLPLVLLPRTCYGKPFVPSPSATTIESTVLNSSSSGQKHLSVTSAIALTNRTIGDTPLPFSVSHQFPYVGIAYYHCRSGREGSLSIGLDIVIFDEPNLNLYPTLDSFLRVYERSFTTWEYERIRKRTGGNNRTEMSTIREFYLRWAMKEALTKALGVGLGMEFNSFECRLVGVDLVESGGVGDGDGDRDGDGIWDYLNLHLSRGSTLDDTTDNVTGSTSGIRNNIVLPAVVRRSIAEGDKSGIAQLEENEIWDFVFVPLVQTTTTTGASDLGYACGCYGPRVDRALDAATSTVHGRNVQVCVEEIEMDDLIRFHRKDKVV